MSVCVSVCVCEDMWLCVSVCAAVPAFPITKSLPNGSMSAGLCVCVCVSVCVCVCICVSVRVRWCVILTCDQDHTGPYT